MTCSMNQLERGRARNKSQDFFHSKIHGACLEEVNFSANNGFLKIHVLIYDNLPVNVI